ncbi:LysM peptidoglycan-binding domain-containing protein [Bifidobacterium breve]|uniref:LysM peptidoglycan-binding domain-containing protein n=1 Tax=Bifidobacterium breve TaxID=1685 RepID=UPI0022AECCA4|nr:LysM peptidoglycan-binding domain-containing protein [Bifidobacterium breve]MCZ4466731.1 LysM peptidoglycan-binding domain-containing protein [Bifidobacterium breve]MCZ4468641.1 LysM peptidoglycan-binding domain-containing protein [Bifidobacterium breve]MCZ4471996.1 LysM peptidoglycan-binding domain-containing protein [Bifidobacterium breve]
MTGSMVMATGRMAGKRSNAYRAARRGAVRRTNAVRSDRRGKVMAVVLAAALAWVGFAMLTAEPARSDTGATQVISYIVRPGDTLWSYASSITPAGQDVSETVDELISLNNLESGALRAGQRLIVPAE